MASDVHTDGSATDPFEGRRGDIVDLLMRSREYLAAGFCEEPRASPMPRWSRAVRRHFEHRAVPAYDGGFLFPGGPSSVTSSNGGDAEGRLLRWEASLWYYYPAELQGYLRAASADERALWERVADTLGEASSRVWVWKSVHDIPAIGITHCVPNYGRVLREGLDRHGERIASGLADAQRRGDRPREDFYTGLADAMIGIRAWHRRLIDAVRRWTAPDVAQDSRRQRLLAALEHVPFQPARTLYEALLAYNFTFYLDSCDNPGRITPEQTRSLLRQFGDNVVVANGWHASLGGTATDGRAAYNDLTRLCLEAARGMSRPNYGLRVRQDMPDEVWDTALDTLATGCGLPGFYNEEAYLGNLRELGVAEPDLTWWNCGGCSETMVHGLSNVGSVDAGINLLLVLEDVLRKHLPGAADFESLVGALKQAANQVVAEVVDGANRIQEAKARFAPHPIRSLLVDDCIDRGTEFHAGGARYNWSIINIAGLSNVADSLAAVREVVFERGEISGADLSALLAKNFQGAEAFRVRLTRCPRFGNDQPEADALAVDLAQHLMVEIRKYRPWRGGAFLLDCVMFNAYVRAGATVGATPDGRRAGEALGDSIGPVQGRDGNGLTAMVLSVTRLPLRDLAGTPVLNLRLQPELFVGTGNRQKVRDLVVTYFRLGGMQVQINVVDQATLRDAMAHPERHRGLVVRVAGYCARFTDLSRALQTSILERTEHAR